jgi:hypothetical protein
VISPVPVAKGDLRTSWLERSASAAALLALLLFVVSQRVSVDDGSPRVIARTPAINEPAPPATAELPALALEFLAAAAPRARGTLVPVRQLRLGQHPGDQ